jgi:hypothetical protein
MKILRKGELPTAAATPWWVGKTAECRVCGCQVLLEAGDDSRNSGDAPAITAHAERHIGGRQWVNGPCPTPECPGKLELENVFSSQITGAAGAREFNPAPAKP